jgi:putative sterol carrier protein
MSNAKPNLEAGSRFARFSDLTRPGDPDVYASFDRMAKQLEGSGIKGKVQFSILDGDNWKQMGIQLESSGAKVQKEPLKKPDLEILTRKETWEQIASGALSPVDAFVNGKMRVRGNYKLGPRIIKHLAVTPGRIDIC